RLPWGDRAKAMRAALLARGVLMHTAGAWDQVLRFMAPLTIEDELLDRGLAAFEDALESLDLVPQRPSSTSSHVPHPTAPATYLHPPPEHAMPTPIVPDLPGRNLEDAD
ncbi:MAG: hypothetical protein ACHQ0I_01180, partial [Candidatus Lutacidiplasmatales archaeon]